VAIVNRRGSGVIIVLGLFALMAPRVGESDHSESRAIGSIRAIVSAESAYAATHGGRFATLACLGDPACNPSDVGTAPFLSPDLATTRGHDGYRFAFYPHPDPDPARSARTALTRFAVAAVPVDRETKGRRPFCADDRGVVYVTSARVAPRVEHGRCLDTSEPLR